MKYILIVPAVLLLAGGAAAHAQTPTADELLSRMESAMYPDSFYARITMETHRPDRRDSSLTMETYHKDGVGSLIQIVAPARSRGTRLLEKSDSLWMYNPRSGSNRAIRLSPRESFQGSVFSNSDVGDPTYTDDYTAQYRDDETIDNPTLGKVACRVIVAEPTTEKAAYGRIVAWLRTSDSAPVQMELYAKSGLLFKRMVLSNFESMAGRQRPTVMRMESTVQEDTYSVVTIEHMESRDDLADSMFTQTRLTR